MEFGVENYPTQNEICQGCLKKQQLIEKYQNLITLLKKKADRHHISHSNKHSMGDLTTSNSSLDAGNFLNRAKLPILLCRLLQKCIVSVFYEIKSEVKIKKCLNARQFLNKIQKLLLNKQIQVLMTIKLSLVINKDETNQLCQQSSKICQNLTQNLNPINLTMHKSLSMPTALKNQTQILHSNKKSKFSKQQNSITSDYLNYKSLALLNQDFINSTDLSQPLKFKEQSFRSLTNEGSSNLQLKNLYKQIFILEQEIFTYQNKIKTLQKNMQDALTRQIKQSSKKTESLEMVAEQMAQKNQLIAELNQKIIMLQEKFSYQANGILQDQLTQHRKDVQKLEKINIKLQNQFRKVKQNLTQTQYLLKLREQQKFDYQNKMNKLKQKLFESEHKMNQIELIKLNFVNSCRKIENILQRLKHYQKDFFLHFKSNDRKSDLVNFQERQEIQQFYKLELIFVYLYNIEGETYYFQEHEHLFDEEQLEVLKQFKKKFKDLKRSQSNKVDLMETIQCVEYGVKEAKIRRFENEEKNIENNHQTQNVYCHKNLVDGSIFDMLNDHRQKDSRIQEIPSRRQRLDHQNNLTMKLLQMEIQKNKQIEKISELKQKNMYIRNIILNLIKSLQLRQNTLKTQTTGILELIFDVFEYSQEEKNIIFTNAQQPKQKRFFGLI